MKKKDIDRQAEREGIALKQQGISQNSNYKRIKHQNEYNKQQFDKLFKD